MSLKTSIDSLLANVNAFIAQLGSLSGAVNAAANSATSAAASAANAVAVVTGGAASLTPSAGKIPLADANGLIDAKWLPDSGIQAKAITQAIYLTAAASGSTGITVPYSAAWALGTNNFALHAKFALPDWTPAAATVIASIRLDGSNIIWWYVDTDGKLGIYAYIAGVYVIPASKSTVATGLADGTMADIEIDVVRESVSVAGSITFRVNGVTLGAPVVLAAATPASLTMSSPLYFGGTSTSRSAGVFQSCELYNRALTSAEALYLCLNGVAYESIGARQAALVTGTDSTFSGAGNWVAGLGTPTFDVNSTVPGKLFIDFSSGNQSISLPNKTIAGKRYRISGKVRLNSGSATTLTLGQFSSSGPVFLLTGITGTESTFSGEFIASSTGLDIGCILTNNNGSAYEFDDIELVQVGATLYLPPEGVQPTGQWLDASGNGNHAALPASGASLTSLMDRGMYRWTTPITGDTTLTSIVPAGFELDKIVFNNSTANALSVRLGTTAGGVDVFGLTALNTSATLGGFKTLACNQAFSLTAAQTLYLSSTSWNSASLTATFYFRRVA